MGRNVNDANLRAEILLKFNFRTLAAHWRSSSEIYSDTQRDECLPCEWLTKFPFNLSWNATIFLSPAFWGVFWRKRRSAEARQRQTQTKLSFIINLWNCAIKCVVNVHRMDHRLIVINVGSFLPHSRPLPLTPKGEQTIKARFHKGSLVPTRAACANNNNNNKKKSDSRSSSRVVLSCSASLQDCDELWWARASWEAFALTHAGVGLLLLQLENTWAHCSWHNVPSVGHWLRDARTHADRLQRMQTCDCLMDRLQQYQHLMAETSAVAVVSLTHSLAHSLTCWQHFFLMSTHIVDIFWNLKLHTVTYDVKWRLMSICISLCVWIEARVCANIYTAKLLFWVPMVWGLWITFLKAVCLFVFVMYVYSDVRPNKPDASSKGADISNKWKLNWQHFICKCTKRCAYMVGILASELSRSDIDIRCWSDIRRISDYIGLNLKSPI